MTNQTVPGQQRNHLRFLDGLRGLAALYVVAHHALLQITFNYPAAQMSGSFHHATIWLMFGQLSVDIFIVLSGFCLMIPVVRGDGFLRGGLLSFVKRRARRILPPYYAALALSLALIALVPALAHPVNFVWLTSVPAFTPSAIISHLLLVHNLNKTWLHRIDYPLWSVATEWQIYFIFALALLPIWRRLGAFAAVAVAFVVGYIPHFLFHHALDGACFHFIGLFALGMAGANLAFAKDEKQKAAAALPIWGILSAAAAIVFLILAITRTEWLLNHYTLNDTLGGVATAGLLTILARQSQGLAPTTRLSGAVIRILEARPVVALGVFSYSLYLIHAPLLALMFTLAPPAMSAAGVFLLSELVGVPICVAAAFGFHVLFERPFMSEHKPRPERVVEQEAAAASAP